MGPIATAEADRPLVAAAAMVAGYLGAARMLWPLRAEIDRPDRARVLLRPRSGRVLLEHLIVPAAVTVVGAVAGAAPAAVAGHPSSLAIVAIAAAPLLTLCAAMSARRGGRVPQTLLVTALAADPTGGGAALGGWFAWWPVVAVATGGAPLALAASGAPALAAVWIVTAAAVLTWLAKRDLEPESSA